MSGRCPENWPLDTQLSGNLAYEHLVCSRMNLWKFCLRNIWPSDEWPKKCIDRFGCLRVAQNNWIIAPMQPIIIIGTKVMGANVPWMQWIASSPSPYLNNSNWYIILQPILGNDSGRCKHLLSIWYLSRSVNSHKLDYYINAQELER